MIKLIATDMDGTFLDDHNQFPREFRSVFHQLNEQGIIFGAASGRQYYNLVERFHEVKDDMLFIAENGTYVVYKGKELYSNTIKRELAMELVELARTIDGTDVILCGKQSAYIEKSHDAFLQEVDKYYAKRVIVDDLMQVEDDILKVTLYDYTSSEHNSNRYFDAYREHLQVSVSGMHWLDITNSGSNKGVAIKKVQEYFNVTADQTMVFGDYLNDLEMMQSAYHSYAMANAHEKLKAVARFEAKTNNEAGVIETIKDRILMVK
ncbi:MAG: Cof-type HAD-IIB family hydrolase [Bacillus sp. (in: firmicutes)]